jgi:hypothetical protein
MDAARAAAATTRPEAEAPSDPLPPSSRSGKKKTDWEAAYRDIEATRALARAGAEARRGGDAPDEALARDLMDKLAAIGSEGADELLAQSPAPRKREEE